MHVPDDNYNGTVSSVPCRVNQDGSLSILNMSSRILPTNPFLTIADVQSADAGTYVCTASNPAGESAATFQLIVFSQSNVVFMPLMSFPMPSRMRSCHELNTTAFEVQGGVPMVCMETLSAAIP